MEESELRELIREYAMQVRLDQGEASLTSVLKRVIAENPAMKTQVRSSVALIKEVIGEVNSMEEADLSESSTSLPVDEASEYEMLVRLVSQKLLESPELKKDIKSLMIYGSYAKRLHIVGESDINFLIVLTADKDSEKAIETISNIAEEIVTPEIAHIFDLMILKEDDIAELEKFGPDFTHIHALYAKEGELIFGENLFSKLEISDEQVQESSKILITEAISQIDEIINTAKEEDLPEDELDYLIGASIIDIAFGLSCHKAGVKSVSMDLVKPDIHEEILEVWGNESEFSAFYPLLEKAHAFKLGIKLPESDNFMATSVEFIKKVIEYTGLQE
ncbi:MAG: hypothetical protein ACW97Z_02185 [Candidatus Hodarchaeales archaeon]|jgi:predicted nucleotidyltransferase